MIKPSKSITYIGIVHHATSKDLLNIGYNFSLQTSTSLHGYQALVIRKKYIIGYGITVISFILDTVHKNCRDIKLIMTDCRKK